MAKCIREGLTLETLPLAEYKKFDEAFEDDVYDAVDIVSAVKRRISAGGPSPDSVNVQIGKVREFLLSK